MKKVWIQASVWVLFVFLLPVAAFSAAQQPPESSGSSSSSGGVETCFGSGDVGFESACIQEAAIAEKEISYCDMIQIPQMARECTAQVTELKKIR